jgi:thiol-disulfide isomerase/thioredoxin
LLAQEVVRTYGSNVQLVIQDLGASPLAESFGVDKYPAIFVDDALVARPEDFYAWGGPPTGRYIPWSDETNRREFQGDLRKMIDLRLAGGVVATAKDAPRTTRPQKKKLLPDVALTTLDGKPFRFSDLRGKPVLIEFWAPWCPHCMSTLAWMKQFDPKKVQVVAIAIESPREHVEKAARDLPIRGRVAMGGKDVREAFDGPPAIPTLYLADRNGAIVRVFYGAPPTLHADIEKELARLR